MRGVPDVAGSVVIFVSTTDVGATIRALCVLAGSIGRAWMVPDVVAALVGGEGCAVSVGLLSAKFFTSGASKVFGARACVTAELGPSAASAFCGNSKVRPKKITKNPAHAKRSERCDFFCDLCSGISWGMITGLWIERQSIIAIAAV